MNKKDYKYIVIFKNCGFVCNQGNAVFKTLKELEDFIMKGNISIIYIGEYKPLKIKLEGNND